jgi:gluconate 2-dehydrogenase gamma chain
MENADAKRSSFKMIARRHLLASAAAFLVLGIGRGYARNISGSLPWAPNTAQPPVPVRPGPWQFFTADEAKLVEAMVDRVIPPDERGPGGKDAGCAVFIDRQLAGPYGASDDLYMRPPFMPGLPTQGYQNPEAPAARYRAGLKAIADHVRGAFSGKSFSELSPKDQDEVLTGIDTGKIALPNVDGVGFFALLLQNTEEGFFADPIYGGNRDMAGWKLIGFPGARYDYRDWIERHNERYPLPPVGIMGRSAWNVSE